MIRTFQNKDLDVVMQIWLETNKKAHSFISEKYWQDNFETVKIMMTKAEVYVFEGDNSNQICGFIGMIEEFIAGIFVKEEAQSKGIGKQLLDYVKSIKQNLSLSVYQKNTNAIRFYEREAFFIQSKGVDESTNEQELFMIWRKNNP